MNARLAHDHKWNANRAKYPRTRRFSARNTGSRRWKTIESNGHVIICPFEDREEHSVVGEFLGFLAGDIDRNPNSVKTISPDLVSYALSLVEGVDVDLDAPLSEEDE